jgi:mRNA interferase RelE/StbE
MATGGALYGFAFSDAALKALKEIPAKFRGQIRRKIEGLANDPKPQGHKKLDGVMDGPRPVYRVRSGDYRVLYSIRNSPWQIVVLDIDHRKDVYR